jgi:hypothetical protein
MSTPDYILPTPHGNEVRIFTEGGETKACVVDNSAVIRWLGGSAMDQVESFVIADKVCTNATMDAESQHANLHQLGAGRTIAEMLIIPGFTPLVVAYEVVRDFAEQARGLSDRYGRDVCRSGDQLVQENTYAPHVVAANEAALGGNDKLPNLKSSNIQLG